ncbi:rRNA maturation RNase YbeY [Patescibacteria group bacterium]|nr:rRNA maturation RNase YbeY [Patescibacteria group bacterium]MBU4099512.1 rRNA maturation RNase YbeY [Patescibacteria group bacterium]
MDNVDVLIFVESRYRVDRKRIKSVVFSVLEEQSVKSHLEVSIAIVGDRKMKALNKKYRQKETTTNILTFPLSEGESTRLPKDILHLGDIVISYPQVILEAAAEEMLVDDRMEELVRHGMLHLLGLHHE